jgi:hypothetical protein
MYGSEQTSRRKMWPMYTILRTDWGSSSPPPPRYGGWAMCTTAFDTAVQDDPSCFCECRGGALELLLKTQMRTRDCLDRTNPHTIQPLCETARHVGFTADGDPRLCV